MACHAVIIAFTWGSAPHPGSLHSLAQQLAPFRSRARGARRRAAPGPTRAPPHTPARFTRSLHVARVPAAVPARWPRGNRAGHVAVLCEYEVTNV